MLFLKCEIPDLIIIEPKLFSDSRGYFMENYRKDLFLQHGINEDFVQDNESKSVKGTLRGLHFQKAPYAQAKLIRVIEGEVLDVAVDMRQSSPYFKSHVAVTISAENKRLFYIPKGFAHGFYVLSDTAVFSYKCSQYYAPEFDSGLRWNDPELNIPWPAGDKILSEKDKNQAEFKNAYYFA